MKKIFKLFLAVLILAAFSSQAFAYDYYAAVYKQDNISKDTGLTQLTTGVDFVVYTAGTTSEATITRYNDRASTAVTNPVTTTNFAAAAVCGGLVKFRATTATVDIVVNHGAYQTKISGFTPNNHVILIDEKSNVMRFNSTSPNTNAIYVDSSGSDTAGTGAFYAPYATLTKAFTAVTTARKTVMMHGGDYNEAAAVVWPGTNGVSLIGYDGDVVISSSASVTHVIGIDPAAASGTWSATLTNITIDHGNYVGLQVDNASVGKRINLYLNNFATSAGSGSSIDINRTGAAGNAIRVYADGTGQMIEGLVTVITESTDDRFRFKGYRMIGGFTVVGAIASEVTLINVGMLTSGLTVDGTNELTNIGCWYETDANPNVYTNFANAFATY